MSEVRVIVCGSRRWHDRQAIQERLYDLTVTHAPNYPLIVHGGARGADRLADEEAGKAGLRTEAHPADWSLGKRAGLIRNEQMARLGADLCIAFWDGRSTGTQHMVDTAERFGIPTEVILQAGVASPEAAQAPEGTGS
jgi:hypothetical protein